MAASIAVSELTAALPTDSAAAVTTADAATAAPAASAANSADSHPYPPSAAAAAAPAPAAAPAASLLQNAAPSLVDPSTNDDLPALDDPELDALRDEIYSHLRGIRDPEHPHTIEALGVVYKSGLTVHKEAESRSGHVAQESVHVEFKPTVPHCSLATLIGLCIRTKVLQEIPGIKFSIAIKEGSHQTAEQSQWATRHADQNRALAQALSFLLQHSRSPLSFCFPLPLCAVSAAVPVNKQLNDKERATAALENPALRETVEKLIKDQRAYE